MTFKMFVYKQLTNNPESKQYVLIQKQKIIPVAYINNKVWPQFRNTKLYITKTLNMLFDWF